jgi:hypothetical protein
MGLGIENPATGAIRHFQVHHIDVHHIGVIRRARSARIVGGTMRRALSSVAVAAFTLSMLAACNAPQPSTPTGAVQSGGSDQGSMATSDMIAAARNDFNTTPEGIYIDPNTPKARCPDWFDLQNVSVQDWKLVFGQVVAEVNFTATTKQPIPFNGITPINACLGLQASRDIAVGETLNGVKEYRFERWASGWRMVPDS